MATRRALEIRITELEQVIGDLQLAITTRDTKIAALNTQVEQLMFLLNAAAPPIPDPPPDPEPPPGPSAPALALVSATGSAETNYPLLFQYAFADGLLATGPVIQYNGVSIDTQYDILETHASTNVKRARIAAIIDSVPPIATITMTIASPAVVTWASHDLAAGDRVIFKTDGLLPTGAQINKRYFVIATGLTGSAFQFSETAGGAAVNTSGTQNGTHQAAKANITFVNGASVAGSPVATPAVTASIGIRRDATTTTKTIQSMLDATDYETIFSGPICKILWCGDPVDKTYDMTTVGDSIKSIRPMFELIIWAAPVSNQKVHAHALNVDCMQLRDEVMDECIVTIGTTTYNFTTTPTIIAYGTRGQRIEWTGTAPGNVNFDMDLDYLGGSAKILPNYDTEIGSLATESWIAGRYAAWQAAPKGFNARGLWPTSLGASWEGQVDPGYMVAALVTGDYRMREIGVGQAQHYCYRAFLVEGDTGRFFDLAETIPGIGKPLNPYGTRNRERLLDSTATPFSIVYYDEAISLGSDPVTVASGSQVVTIASTAHRFTTGQQADIAGLTTVQGLNPNRNNATITRIDANSFSYSVTTGAASANGSGGGASGVVTRNIKITDVMSGYQASHASSPFFIPAIMTGEYSWVWLQQVHSATTPFIETQFQGVGIPDSFNNVRRWMTTSPYAIMAFSSETRGVAWEMLNRIRGYQISDEGTPEKAHFLKLIIDQLCYEAGRRNISLPAYSSEAAYTCGQTAQNYGSGPTACVWPVLGWYPEITSDSLSGNDAIWDTPGAVKAIQPRQHNYLVNALGVALDAGLTGFQPLMDVWGNPVKTLMQDALAGSLDAVMIAAGEAAADAPKMIALFQAATWDSTASPNAHTSWAATLGSLNNTEISNIVNKFDTGTSYYPVTGYIAASRMLTEASAEWQWLVDNLRADPQIQTNQFLDDVVGWIQKPRT